MTIEGTTGQQSILPVGNSTTAIGLPPFTDAATPFNLLPPSLQGMGVHVVHLAPPTGVTTAGNLTNLAGPAAGLEGVRLATQLYGDQQWPFTQVIVNAPYIYGAYIERQDIPERKFNLGVVIGNHAPPMTELQYRMAEDRWWAGQDETQDGWLGIYTRFSGWRWIPVRPDEQVKTPLKMDETAFGNNSSSWDITWIAQRPYFTKPALYSTWSAATSGQPVRPPPGLISGETDLLDLYYSGTVPLANRGDLPTFVNFLVSSPGQAIVQDNSSNRLVVLPATAASVGTYLCDTEPAHRTLTAANDPQDNLLFDLIRQSTILDYFLSGLANEGIPLQLTFQNRFIYQVPARTECSFTVYHSEPGGLVTVILPQRFKRSR